MSHILYFHVCLHVSINNCTTFLANYNEWLKALVQDCTMIQILAYCSLFFFKFLDIKILTFSRSNKLITFNLK